MKVFAKVRSNCNTAYIKGCFGFYRQHIRFLEPTKCVLITLFSVVCNIETTIICDRETMFATLYLVRNMFKWIIQIFGLSFAQKNKRNLFSFSILFPAIGFK